MQLQNPIKSVGMKLFLIFFVCIIILVLAVGLFSYSQAKQIVKDKMASATGQTIGQSAEKLQLQFSNYESLTMQILTDQEYMKSVQAYKDADPSSYERLTLFKTVSDKLNTFTSGTSGIAGVSLISISDGRVIGNTSTGDKPDIANEAWMKRMIDADGAAVWLETSKTGFVTSSPEPVLAVGRLLKNLNTGSKDFVLLFEIKLSAINESIGELNLGDGSQIMVLNDKEQIVRSEDKEAIGTTVELKLDKESLDESLKTAQSKTSTLNGTESLIVYKKLKTSGWLLAATTPVSELVKDAKKILTATIYAAIIAAVIAAVIGLLMAQMIGRPLVKLRNLMKQGEQGNLTVRTNSNRSDEIGQLGASFNQMMEQITRLVQQTNQSASEVLENAGELLNASKQTATSAKEIAVATEEIANGASSLAVEAEKGNGLTYEMGNKMKQVILSNVRMGDSASVVREASEQGSRYMEELTLKTNTTEEMTRSMVEKVDKLKESTSSIRKILDVLNNMTKQTNILSLNATIEAARAGTAGKGFMVVADEIRKLAEQSKQSIDVVRQITDTIQLEIDETVSVLSAAYPVFQEQIASVKEAGIIFNQVQTNMGGFVQQLSEVTESITVLDESQLVLTEAMSNVSAVSEESSATSEEVASLSNEQLSVSQGLVRLSENLERLSKSLQDSLSKFTV
ncbi:MAG: methyl-accepting chemotaxis protein [Paenibacillaceae bacterium]|nr:methyl-accepting chemotaxis protein [Paenibacillaceae bacterium]